MPLIGIQRKPKPPQHPQRWTNGAVPTGAHTRQNMLAWERGLKLYDLKGDALLELGTGMAGPHYFGQWVAKFYRHWQNYVCRGEQDTLDHFYIWLETELKRSPRDVNIERILDEDVANGQLRVREFDTTRRNLNEIQRFLEGVRYITIEADRIKYLVRFQGGSVFRRREIFDTTLLATVSSGPGWAIWVRGPNGKFYSHSHKVGRVHHSTFLAGGSVLAAGEWRVTHGKITCINGKSGHYQPGMQSLWHTVQCLHQLGVMHPGTGVILYSRADHAMHRIPELLNYQDFLANDWKTLLEHYLVDKNSHEPAFSSRPTRPLPNIPSGPQPHIPVTETDNPSGYDNVNSDAPSPYNNV